ncbi:MAG: polysaccharide pyruvyl transferase family protein [Lachnospiraceae bacterium]|nr:polysaccharide pyruvyl transferase family protein [Lachnospiraceae bacterium]
MEIKANEKFTILLLTNRDSDNVGDQVIEASDIALIHAVMKNLNVNKSQYKINSRSASIVTKKYMATRDQKLLKGAEKAIQEADLVLFGGAPVFNYHYQNFYERTAITLELAKKYDKPVIFSAIGVESYDEKSKKCQRLKATLNFDCVKQITTRDGLEALEKYIEKDDITIGRVSDPAVFCAPVFSNYATKKNEKKRFFSRVSLEENENKKKKIGIFVLRANGFKDNHVDFSREEAAELWLDVIRELKKREYDYELLSSGHFGDESFLDYLIRNYNVSQSKCVFNMNLPEILLKQMSDYDGVITCRLHPSIISFSMNIPAVSLVWNSKVTGFYNGIGYPNRAIERPDFNAEEIVNRLEQAMDEGISKDETYLMSVYNSLFCGIRNIVCPQEKNLQPYSYEKLIKSLPAFAGTSKEEQNEKLKRKFRRTYELCNKRFEDIQRLKEEINELKQGANIEETK